MSVASSSVEDMFDDRPLQPPGSPSGAPVGVLDAAHISSWRDDLTASLATMSGLDDAGRVDAIRALEEAICVATAAQASLARELDASTRAAQARAGLRAGKRGLGVGAQVALARRESPERGRRHLGLAKVVAAELPHTWAAWRAGRITEWRATLIARETACLSIEHRLEVDRVVAADADVLERMGDAQVARECAKEAVRLDAAAVTKRRRKAESERTVTLRPAPDSMAYVTALLPVKDGVAVYAVLSRSADAARAAGDPRARGQVMADTLVEAVLAAGARARADQTTWHQAPADNPALPKGAGTPIRLNLVMSDHALFGASDEPAHLQDFGPIPAELAREIIAGACEVDEKIWLRRLYASPATGELVSMDTRVRLFRNSLARFIRLRDQVCRTPWCDAPVRHIDHVRSAAVGGATSRQNGQGLCEACNYAKDAPGWRARAGPDGTNTTTTPTGHTHLTRPPPVASIRHRALPPLQIDYIQAG